jgi:NTP pyrophosphatase (non-canonical NTP hydrolase)
MKNIDEYQELAMRTAGSPDRVMPALGLAGEVGEYVELIKKWRYHGKDLDLDKAAKELGDVLWYVAVAARSIGLDLSDVAERNIAKLRERYPEGFVEGGGIRGT